MATQRFPTEKDERMYNATKTCTKASDVPNFGHYAVIVSETMRYDDGHGDDRSGPSYSTLEYLTYISFADSEALQGWILENHSKKSYKVISAKPVRVELKTVISVEDN